MKRRDLMRRLSQLAKDRGEEMVTNEGGAHTKVTIGDLQTVVPRHNEINEQTARSILKHMGGRRWT